MLPEIRIASPCTANWEKMTGDVRARHCTECNLDVYNFSAMTSAEIESFWLPVKVSAFAGASIGAPMERFLRAIAQLGLALWSDECPASREPRSPLL